jgi:hypothetical protein
MLGASELVSHDEDLASLHVPSPWAPPAHAAAGSLADSNDEVPILRLAHHRVLVLCGSDVVPIL